MNTLFRRALRTGLKDGNISKDALTIIDISDQIQEHETYAMEELSEVYPARGEEVVAKFVDDQIRTILSGLMLLTDTRGAFGLLERIASMKDTDTMLEAMERLKKQLIASRDVEEK